jgi:DNA-binding MarR family transcriptional regulator
VLRALIQRFIRQFGLLSDDTAPCGQPLPTSQVHALMVPLRTGAAGLSQGAPAAELGIHKSNVSRMVRQFEQKGLATTTAGPEDARVRLVRLNPHWRARSKTQETRNEESHPHCDAALGIGRREL